MNPPDTAGLARPGEGTRISPYFPLVSRILLVCAGYYGAEVIALALRLEPGGISTIWVPQGVLLAAFLLTPVRVWWLYLAALLPVHLHLVNHFQGSVPFAVQLIQFGGNVGQAMLGALVVQSLIAAPRRLDEFRHMILFLVLGVVLPVAVVSAGVAGLFFLTGWVDEFQVAWHRRTLTGICGGVALTPLIVQMVTEGMPAIKAMPRRRCLEFAVLTIGLAAFVTLALGLRPSLASQYALFFAPLPLLLWTAVRFGPGGLSLHLLIVALAALAATKAGHGPFIAGSAAETVIAVDTFLLAASIPLLLLAALVAERSRAEATLHASEERYREVVESQTELVCRYLPDTTLTFVNEAYCRFFGQRREELIGRKFLELIPEKDRAAALEHVTSLATRMQSAAHEDQVVMPDGSIRWWEWTDHAIRLPHGAVELQGIGRDVTDRKRAEEANQTLTHLSRVTMLGELSGSLAHELNQPLTAILANAQAAQRFLAQNPANFDEIGGILNDIVEDDKRAGEVIRRLRVLLKKDEPHHESLDLNEVVRDVMRLMRSDLINRNVTVSAELAPDLPQVQGDRVHMQQVLLNLMMNGCEAMIDGGESSPRLLLQTTVAHPSGVEIAVSDEGRGIDPDDMDRIFEPFVTTKPQGMGLGLAVCRTIIQAHGGRLWAANNADRGATFYFRLPSANGAMPSNTTTAH